MLVELWTKNWQGVKEGEQFQAVQKKKVGRNKSGRGPPVAVRQSTRIKRDGVSIVAKAQRRADSKNDISGMSRFAILHSVDDDCLERIAVGSGVNLGPSKEVITEQIQLIKAREMAQALLFTAQKSHIVESGVSSEGVLVDGVSYDKGADGEGTSGPGLSLVEGDVLVNP
ncbi:hypothetical protein GUJ93_ZPchr0002g24423 [Zizania palustris]|uniref:Uncharacterized protein n=1 Tax=Zizania palustris TaxID=103762 RepID=A0A8J5S9E1_ZIZPA|nr:hypothetical protein GUJ93_ZPchr0002g24423 [Zizania palustris]